MKRTVIVIVLSMLSSLPAWAQDQATDDLLTTKSFRYGIYKTFQEFRDNAPSITSEFKIKTIGEGKYLHYLLFDKRGRPVRDVYGFSDGKKIYVNAANYSQPVNVVSSDASAASYQQQVYFMPVLTLGKVCYLEDFVARSKVAAMETISPLKVFHRGAQEVGEGIAEKNPGWVIYLPDDDGYVHLLNKETLGTILKMGAPDLYAEFNGSAGNEDYDVLMSFLQKINARDSD